MFARGGILKTKDFVYTGCDNLEAMAEAVNYNRYLIKLITEQLHKVPVGDQKKLKILDFGAGSGTYADLLKTKNIIVDCLEPDKTLQKILKKKGYKVIGDIKELKPASYDLVYSLNVFEHIEDDHGNFAALTRVLTKKGTIIIYVPAFPLLFSSMDELVGHHRRYKKNRLRDMANSNQMSVSKLQYCDPLGFAASLAFKASRNQDGRISAKAVRFYDRLAFPLSQTIEPLFKHAIGKNAVLVAHNQ